MTISCEKMDLSETSNDNDLESSVGDDDDPSTSSGQAHHENDTTITDEMRFGSKTYPYVPSDFTSNKAMREAWLADKESFTCKWVAGYIVGFVNGTSMKSATFGVGTKETNIIIADSPNITDSSLVMPVQLSKSNKASQAIRDAVNLSSHPENLYRRIKICADIDDYMSVIGLKNTTSFCWID